MKQKRINIRVSEEEYQAIKELCIKLDQKPSGFARSVLLTQTEKQGKRRIKKEQKPEKRDIRLYTRVDEKTEKRIKDVARKDNKRLSTIVREMLCAGLDRKELTLLMREELQDELRDLTFQLSKIGANINQMAHHSNTIKRVQDENQVLKTFLRIEEAVNQYIAEKIKKET